MKNQILNFINLHNGEEKREKVLENILSNISFRGSNLWILACAIVIASVGLNVNSTAVIIGAMLISPLMGPIVGAGLALAIYDFDLLKKSAKNLIIATVVSLSVAFIYFYISPFKETQSELLARTSPTIYDVLIAFFGGLAGIIALTRVEKGNPIPGVAIATALMPPLCTAGYGLAVGKYTYFFGAFYLYIINCFFICIATFFIIKYLKYPAVNNLNPKFEKKIRYGISALIVLMIVPSFYLAYNLFQQKKFNQKAEEFIATEFTQKGYTVIFKNINYNSQPRKIELAFLAQKLDNSTLDKLNHQLANYGLDHTRLSVRQNSKNLKDEIIQELGIQNKDFNQKDLIIQELQSELNLYKYNNPSLIREMNILFPEMKEVSVGKHVMYPETDSTKINTVILYKTNKELEDTKKIENWLALKLGNPNFILIQKN